jgi:hypothetical protein
MKEMGIMKIKKTWTLLMGLAISASLAFPALAADMRARIKAVGTADRTITVIEGGKDYTFVTTDATKFVNAQGVALTGEIAGYLKAGTRVAITYETREGKAVASEIKLRDVGGSAPSSGK